MEHRGRGRGGCGGRAKASSSSHLQALQRCCQANRRRGQAARSRRHPPLPIRRHRRSATVLACRHCRFTCSGRQLPLPLCGKKPKEREVKKEKKNKKRKVKNEKRKEEDDAHMWASYFSLSLTCGPRIFIFFYLLLARMSRK